MKQQAGIGAVERIRSEKIKSWYVKATYKDEKLSGILTYNSILPFHRE